MERILITVLCASLVIYHLMLAFSYSRLDTKYKKLRHIFKEYAAIDSKSFTHVQEALARKRAQNDNSPVLCHWHPYGDAGPFYTVVEARYYQEVKDLANIVLDNADVFMNGNYIQSVLDRRARDKAE